MSKSREKNGHIVCRQEGNAGEDVRAPFGWNVGAEAGFGAQPRPSPGCLCVVLRKQGFGWSHYLLRLALLSGHLWHLFSTMEVEDGPAAWPTPDSARRPKTTKSPGLRDLPTQPTLHSCPSAKKLCNITHFWQTRNKVALNNGSTNAQQHKQLSLVPSLPKVLSPRSDTRYTYKSLQYCSGS